MTSISRISFAGENVNNAKPIDNKENNKKEKPVYVSKNPDRAVAATGVVAGTSGMIGGAVLGGVAGAVRLPRELTNIAVNSNYGQAIQQTLKNVKLDLTNSTQLKELTTALNGLNSTNASEGVLNIAGTLTKRLHNAFAHDKAASSVIDKVFDPIIGSVTVRKNKKSLLAGIINKAMSPKQAAKVDRIMQQPGVKGTILKFLGFGIPTSRIIGKATGNITEGISQAVINVKNFTPEERVAWKKVSAQIFEEFEHNKSLKAFGGVAKALKGMAKNTDWIKDPLNSLTEGLKTNVDGIKNLIKTLDKKVIGKLCFKTVGAGSVIGAAVCGTLSLFGWSAFKNGLMKKETAKTEAINA